MLAINLILEREQLKSLKHNRLNVGGIVALEPLVGALINCSLLQSVGGRESLNGTKKFNSGLRITTLEANIYHYYDLKFKKWHQFRRTFHLTFSIKLPPIEFSRWKLRLREF